MKKLFLLLFAGLAFLSSCKKADPMLCTYTTPVNVATPAEITYLQNYLAANSINAVQHSSGVFYIVSDAGTGSMPNVCSNITIKYIGKLLGGNIFDSNTSVIGVKFVLGQLILGCQRVLPILKTGGSITMYIPPSLGYGQNEIRDSMGNLIVPAYSYLEFSVELLDVQ